MSDEIKKPAAPADGDWQTDVKEIKLEVDGSGDFTKSKLLWLRDSDNVEPFLNKDGKPHKTKTFVSYVGKGDFTGYAHSIDGRVLYSTDHGIGLFNVTAWAEINETPAAPVVTE